METSVVWDDAARIRDEGLRLLSKHLIAINVTDCQMDAEGRHFNHESYVASAFVVSVQNVWCLITAGHVLDYYHQRIASGRKIVAERLIDGLAFDPGRPHFPAVPFPLEIAHKCRIDRDGLDLALILLTPLIVAQLDAGGVVALDESGWADVPETREGYLLLGFPKQLTNARVEVNGNEVSAHVSIGVPLLVVHRIDDPPFVLKREHDGFLAKVPEQTVIIDGKLTRFETVSGMSGGPILAFVGDRYWVIAVQSEWAPQSRVIRATYIRPFLDGLTKMIEDQRREEQR